MIRLFILASPIWAAVVALVFAGTPADHAAAAPGCPQEWIPDANTAGLWHFNDGLDPTADSSGNGYAGDLVNGPAFVAGAFGSALSFDGANDYVTMGNQPGLNVGTGDFTIEACIKTPAAPPPPAVRIVGKNTPDTGPGYNLDLSSGRPMCMARDAGPLLEVVLTDTAAIDNTNWHHVRCERSGSTLKLYVDGSLVTQGSLAGAGTLNNSEEFRVGLRSIGNPPEQWYTGLIDEVRLSTIARGVPPPPDTDGDGILPPTDLCPDLYGPPPDGCPPPGPPVVGGVAGLVNAPAAPASGSGGATALYAALAGVAGAVALGGGAWVRVRRRNR